MSDYLNRARRYHEAIQAVLLREWDPIGIGDLPEAADEYDGYVGEIYEMLLRHESRQQLTDHLWWIETQHMGLCGNRPIWRQLLRAFVTYAARWNAAMHREFRDVHTGNRRID